MAQSMSLQEMINCQRRFKELRWERENEEIRNCPL